MGAVPAPSVLLIDDDQAFACNLAGFLKQAGHQVTIARGVNEGLAIAQVRQPDLVLLDLALSDGSGWELLDRLREQKHTDVPVIVISCSNVTRAQMKQWQLAGAFLKPFSPQALLVAMQDAQSRRRGRIAKEERNA